MSLSKETKYGLVYASQRVKKEFEKAFNKIPKSDIEAIKLAIKNLKIDPWQKATKIKHLPISHSTHVAHYRIRVGNYRVLYDVDDEKNNIVLLVIARRNEATYKT